MPNRRTKRILVSMQEGLALQARLDQVLGDASKRKPSKAEGKVSKVEDRGHVPEDRMSEQTGRRVASTLGLNSAGGVPRTWGEAVGRLVREKILGPVLAGSASAEVVGRVGSDEMLRSGARK